MRRWAALAFLVLALSSARADESLQEITLSPGDTMWSIANRYLKDPQRWPEIVRYNKLPTADPTMALPGMRIKVPMMLIKEEYRNAEMESLIPEVRYKPKNGADWKEATPNMTLHYEDSLRTMKGGQARIRFPTREIVQVNENSYVVLKPEKIMQEVQLMQGDVRAARAKVIMPGGTIVKPGSVASEFQARVRPDETEVVFVYKGQVDVTAQGKTVTVNEGFGTEVPKSAPPKAPAPLSTFKDFDAAAMALGSAVLPHESAVSRAGKTDAGDGGTGRAKTVVSATLLKAYRIQVSSDSKFSEIVLDKTLPMGEEFNVTKEHIPDGRYYVRVAFRDALGVLGPFSAPNIVDRDTVPPVLTAIVPADNAVFGGDDNFCEVSGNAEGAALLAVNGDVVFLSSDGHFSKFVTLADGLNVINIRARDVHGNETVVERKVTYDKKAMTSR